MEPLTALAVACNVMELISFGLEVATTARKIHRTGSISSELSDGSAHLSQLSSVLLTSIKCSATPVTAAQKQLQEIALRCHGASLELWDEIRKLCPPDGEHSLVRAVQASLKTVTRKNRIKALEDSMRHWQAVMDSGLLLRVW
jgi:hypothetical protein